MNRKPKAIDLFCGCGGLTQGLKQAGFDVVGAVEIDAVAAETYRMNHPEVELWEENISTLSTLSIKRKLNIRKGELDLLAGCPPCQGLSSMRTMNGGVRIRDKRNKLILEFLRYIKDFMPKAIMMENVPELIEHYNFKTFCRELKALGYIINCDVKNAGDYGVPQRRRRTILLAGNGFEIDFARPARRKKTVSDAIRKMPKAGKSGDRLHDMPEKRTAKVKRRIAMIPKNGGSRTALPPEEQLDCHVDCDGFKDVYGRMAWNKQAPTITGGCTNPSKGRFLHPVENRAITLREASLLQTFPHRYKFPMDKGKGAIALMIGNALPCEFINRHAKKIIKTLSLQKE